MHALAIKPTCYQSSVAINNFAINHHLPSNFRLALNPYFYQFFFAKKWKDFSKFGILYSLANFVWACVAWSL